MTKVIVAVLTDWYRLSYTCDCLVRILKATKLTLVWSKVTIATEMLIQITYMPHNCSLTSKKVFTLIGALHYKYKAKRTRLIFQMCLQCPQFPCPLATFTTVDTPYLQLVDLASQTFVDHVTDSVSLCAAVRATALSALLSQY